MRGKIAMPVIAALLLLMAVGGNAAAAPPEDLEAYDAGADSLALDLQVGLIDFQLAAGLTFSGVTSEGPASMGDGTAVLIAGTENGEAESNAPGGPESADACALELDLPSPIDLAGVFLACVESTATLADGAPAATANSNSVTIPIGGSDLTAQLLGALLPVTSELTAALNDILAGVTGTLCVDIGLPLPVVCDLADATIVIDNLLAALGDAAAGVVTVTVAPNSSAASADSVDGVIASAIAEGATIEVLPGLGPDGTAFLEVVVGSSEASVVRDATTGEATAVANPSTVQINVNGIDLGLDEVVDLGLGELLDPITAAVNDLIATLASASPLSCGEPGPLAEIICLDAGTGFVLDAEEAAAEGYDFGEGTVGARTSALRLELLSLLNNGEPAVSLSLAEAVAAANAIPATPAAPTTAPPTTEEDLPRTGSGDFAPLVLAAGLALTAVVLRIRRRSITG